MRAVVTRVSEASVTIDGQIHAKISKGFLVLLGIHTEDQMDDAQKLARKICSMRIFSDESGQMKRGLSDVAGELLLVSQFTLYGDVRRGRRPEFLSAAKPAQAVPLYEAFIAACQQECPTVQTGVFGAMMEVSSINDGPVTLILDTADF